MSIVYENHSLYPESILIRNFIGKVGVDEIIDSWEYLIENNLIKETTRGVINNISVCNLVLDMGSFETLITYLKKKDYLKKIKLAVICNNPKTIIFPVLGESMESDLKIKPFSTVEAAVHWIMND